MDKKRNNLFNNEYDSVIRQLWMLGYCDRRQGSVRDIKEVRNIVKKISNRRNWDESNIDFGIFTVHYYAGVQTYMELLELYRVGTFRGQNPEHEYLYYLFDKTKGFEPIIVEIVKEYPDYEYEMMLYEQEKVLSKKK